MNISNNPFPLLYHTHHQNFCEDIPFWQSLAQWQGDPILELGCGTGRVLVPLAQDGHDVFGIDNSPDMLSFLSQQVHPEILQKIRTIEGNIPNFKIQTKFRLIILPCNTYSTFDSESRASILSCIYEHLVPGGVFGVSIPNPNLLMAVEDTNPESAIETIFIHPNTGYPVQVSSQWEPKGSVLSFIWHYDHLYPNGKVERLTATADHHLASVEQYLSEMLTARFSIRSTYGNFETGPLKPNSNYLIALAQK